MKNTLRLVALLLCLPSGGSAADETDHYSLIWRRNVFALHAAPPPIRSTPSAVAATQVGLAGIAALPPHKWAALWIQQPGQPAMTKVFQEGARIGELEVLEIDANSKWVKINNAGVTMTLTFEKNGLRPGQMRTAPAEPDPHHLPLPAVPPAEAGDP